MGMWQAPAFNKHPTFCRSFKGKLAYRQPIEKEGASISTFTWIACIFAGVFLIKDGLYGNSKDAQIAEDIETIA